MNLLTKFKSNKFLRSLSYLGGSEFLNRIFRLASTVILARSLTQTDYGLLALVMATYEFSHIFTLGSGIGLKLIQCKEEDVPLYSNSCFTLNWIVNLLIALLLLTSSYPLSLFYNSPSLISPICFLSLMFVVIPIGSTHFTFLIRHNKIDKIAKINVFNSFFGNILTVTLSLLNFGLWSVLIPLVLSSLTWSLQSIYYHPSSFSFNLSRSKEILITAFHILGVETLTKLRANLDYILIGSFLGVKTLGLYYFGFNAGLGISISIISAIIVAILPHLSEHKDNLQSLRQAFLSSLKTIAFVIVPFIIFQTITAPFYVPIVFGSQWVQAIPILIIICLSAIPRPFGEASMQLLNVVGQTKVNFISNILFTTLFALCLLLALYFNTGILGVALTVTLVHWFYLPIFSFWSYSKVFYAKT